MLWYMVWMLTIMIAPTIVVIQSTKGIQMTRREFFFFLYGICIIGLPLVYVITHTNNYHIKDYFYVLMTYITK